MTNHYLTFATQTSGTGDVEGGSDATIVTGTSSVSASMIELRWSDVATGPSSYVLRRRDLINALERLKRFIDSNGAAGAAGTDIPIN